MSPLNPRMRTAAVAAVTAASLIIPSTLIGGAAPAAAAVSAPVAPSAPRTPAITAGDGSVTVTWTAPASDGGAPVTAYAVRVAPTGRTVRVAGPAGSATVTGLADGEEVTATVVAENRVGPSPAATTTAVTPVPPIQTVLSAPASERLNDMAVAPDGTTYVATNDSILKVSADGSTVTPLELGTIEPLTIALTAGGDLLWADGAASGGATIRRLHAGEVDTVAGDPEAEAFVGSEPVPALSARLVAPMDLAVSPVDGSVFLVDYLCSVVERFTIGGNLAIVAGIPGACGQGSYGGDGGPAVGANLKSPQSLAIDGTGAVYVADTANNRVRRFTVGGTIQTVAGNGTETHDLGPDLPATSTGTIWPSTIAWAPGRGLIIDSVGRLRLLVDDRLVRLADDTFDRALIESTRSYSNNGIGTNENIEALDWTGPELKALVLLLPGGGDWHGAMRWTGPWLPASEPGAHPGFGSWSDLVKLHHRALVNRPPTATELSSWVSELQAGTKTPGELDDALRRSAENTANVDPVVRMYRAFLGRAPDASGLRFWIGRRRNVAPARTWSMGQLAAQFAGSKEFARKYGSLSNRVFATKIYTDVLNRSADPSGVDFWTKQLDTHRRNRAQVMLGFSESSEYRRKQAENTDVAVAYLSLLDRMPDAAETGDWVTREKAGTSHADLLDELVIAAAAPTGVSD